MSTSNFYPSILDILPVDSLPDNLGIVKEKAEEFLEDIFYKNFRSYGSPSNHIKNYQLTIVSLSELGVNLGGENGVKLLLNPGSQSGTTDIDLSLKVEWDILEYLHNVSVDNISFEPSKIFEQILNMFNVREFDLFKELLNRRFGSIAELEQLKTVYNSSGLGSVSNYTDLEDLYTQIRRQVSIFHLVFTLGIADSSIDKMWQNLKEILYTWIGEMDEKDFLNLFIPRVSCSIDDINLGLAFPRKWLRPLKTDGTVEEDPEIRSMATFTVGSLSYTSQNGFEFEGTNSASLQKSEIGETGFTLEFTNVQVDLSRKENIPLADTLGEGKDFIGVSVGSAELGLPKSWNANQGPTQAKITGTDLLIGNAGISGTFALEDAGDLINMSLGGFTIALNECSITFKNGKITGSTILGTLTFPSGINKDSSSPVDSIQVEIKLDGDGEFEVFAHVNPHYTIDVFSFFDLKLYSLGFGREERNGELQWFAETTAGLVFSSGAMNGLTGGREIKLEGLRIWQDGSFEIQGGTLPLPDGISLPLGPAEVYITAIHLGTYQKDGKGYNYFGFDGGVSVNPGGVDTKGDGVKFFWPSDGTGSSFIRIDSLAIEIIIPGNATKANATAIINGYLSIREIDGAGTEYAGGVTFEMPQTGLGGGAQMRYMPDDAAFLIEAGLEMPTPIVLGATGLGIYGFYGLLGQKFVADKEALGVKDELDENSTWYDYLNVPPKGVNVSKFSGPGSTVVEESAAAFSVGAGASLATIDSGFTFSSKLGFILSVPTALILEGKADVLSERVKVFGDSNPPFLAGLVYEFGESIQLAAGVDFKVPKEKIDPYIKAGDIFTMDARLELGYFFKNPSAWYINFGTKEKPNKATALRIFESTSYFMINSREIAAGSGVKGGFSKKYAGGLVSASVGYYMNLDGKISFIPVQLGGSIELGGHADVSFFGIGFYFALNAYLAAEAPAPFKIEGGIGLKVKVKIGYRWFSVTYKESFTIDFSWEFNKDREKRPINPISGIIGPDSAPVQPETLTPVKAIHMLTKEEFAIYYGKNAPSVSELDKMNIPIDSYIHIDLLKGVKPLTAVNNKIGMARTDLDMPEASLNKLEYQEVVPPTGKEQTIHNYTIDEIYLEASEDGSTWEDYHPYKAMLLPQHLSAFEGKQEDKYLAMWQYVGGDKINKLTFPSQTPFERVFAEDVTKTTTAEKIGVNSARLTCAPNPIEEQCVNWVRSTEHDNLQTAAQWRFGALAGVDFFTDFGVQATRDGIMNTMGAAASIANKNGEIQFYTDGVHIYDDSDQVMANGANLLADFNKAKSVKIMLKPGQDDVYYVFADRADAGVYLSVVDMTMNGGLGQVTIKNKYITKCDYGRFTLVRHANLKDAWLVVHEFESQNFRAFPITKNGISPYSVQSIAGTINDESEPHVGAMAASQDGSKLAISIGTLNLFEVYHFDNAKGLVSNAITIPNPSNTFGTAADDITFSPEGTKLYAISKGATPNDGLWQFDLSEWNSTSVNDSAVLIHTIYEGRGVQTGPDGKVYVAKYSGTHLGIVHEPETYGVDANFEENGLYLEGNHSMATLPSATLPTNEEELFYVQNNFYQRGNLSVQPVGTYAKTFDYPSKFGTHRSLLFKNEGELVIEFPKAVTFLKLKLTTFSSGVSIHLYRKKEVNGVLHEGYIRTINADREAFNDVFEYSNRDTPFNKIIIEPATSDAAVLAQLRQEVEDLYRQYHEDPNLTPHQRNVIFQLAKAKQLEYLEEEAKGCIPDDTVYGTRPNIDTGTGLWTNTGAWIGTGEWFDSTGTGTGNVLIPGINVPGRPQGEDHCSTLLHEVCWLDAEAHAFNITIPGQDEIEENVINAVEGLKETLPPIWRPDTYYRIRVKVSDTIGPDNDAQKIEANVLNGSNTTSYERYFAFKTAGPLGHFHNAITNGKAGVSYITQKAQPVDTTNQNPNADTNLPVPETDEMAVASLKPYLNYQTSYPNPDGNLALAKPLYYYNPEFQLRYSKNYAFSMFNNWPASGSLPALNNNQLVIVVKDPADNREIPIPIPTTEEYEHTPRTTALNWAEDKDANVPDAVREFNKALNPELYTDEPELYTCWTEGGEYIIPANTKTDVIFGELQPQKLYTAVLYNQFGMDPSDSSKPNLSEVYRFVFQTSKYKDFAAQINDDEVTYKTETKKAVFDYKSAFTSTQIDNAYSIVNTWSFNDQYADPFTRLIEGELKILPLDPTNNLEVNVVKQVDASGATLKVIGLWVRSPEPLNDPRVPVNDVKATVQVMNGSTVNSNYKVLLSKDRSEAFIMNSSKNIPTGDLDLKFNNLVYYNNGKSGSSDTTDEGYIIDNSITKTITIE